MFRDYPAEIVKQHKEQMKTFKEARKNGILAAFSQSQPGKLHIRGQLWPVRRELTVQLKLIKTCAFLKTFC